MQAIWLLAQEAVFVAVHMQPRIDTKLGPESGPPFQQTVNSTQHTINLNFNLKFSKRNVTHSEYTFNFLVDFTIFDSEAMRLLNVHSLKLEEFGGEPGNGIPPYAILSHTWGRDEVSFR
jgi:hypothetical protein